MRRHLLPPLWQLLRLGAILVLVAVVVSPLNELRALTSAVYFLSAPEARLAWDPPASGEVDHYVVEVATTKFLDGPENTLAWVDHFTTRDPSYTFSTADGHSYAIRVKAVGPSGNESPYSDEQLTLICDREAPRVSIAPLKAGGTPRGRELTIEGGFSDQDLASITVNGRAADLDLAGGTWRIALPLAAGMDRITVEARDHAGNVRQETLEVLHQPVVITSAPAGAELYLLGTPAYPGIFVGSTPFTVYGVIDPSLRTPLSVRKNGRQGVDQVVSLASGKKELMIPLPPMRRPANFNAVPLSGLDPAWTGNGLVRPFAADLNQDNRMDLLLGLNSGHCLRLECPEDGDLAAAAASPLMVEGDQPLKVGPGVNPLYIDLDNDFAFELVVGDEEGKLTVFRQAGESWTASGTLAFDCDTTGPVRTFAFVDWNRDHKKDLLIADDTDEVKVLLNAGEDARPLFGPEVVSFSLPGRQPGAPLACTDWDGDGRTDLLGQGSGASLVVWTNTGTAASPAFLRGSSLISAKTLGALQLAPAVLDWNQDGVNDLVVGTDNGGLFLLIGKVRRQ